MSVSLNLLGNKIINADLLEQKDCIIVQQVNCQGVMGKGLALQIKRRYPSVFAKYKKLCDSKSQDELIGGVLYATIGNVTVANVFAQKYYGYSKNYTDYNALQNGLNHIATIAKEHNLSIYLPYKIGCGLAGGDWNKVQDIILSSMVGVDYYVCQL